MFKIDYITSSKPVRKEITGIKSNKIIKKQKKRSPSVILVMKGVF